MSMDEVDCKAAQAAIEAMRKALEAHDIEVFTSKGQWMKDNGCWEIIWSKSGREAVELFARGHTLEDAYAAALQKAGQQ